MPQIVLDCCAHFTFPLVLPDLWSAASVTTAGGFRPAVPAVVAATQPGAATSVQGTNALWITFVIFSRFCLDWGRVDAQ
jgi:hypothetical protein